MDDQSISNQNLLDALVQSKSNNNYELIKQSLNAIIRRSKDFNLNICESITSLLDIEQPEMQVTVAKTIAELAKTIVQRNNMTDKSVIVGLLKYLSSKVEDNNILLIIQACRALGNICYDNNEARNLLTELKSLQVMIDLLDQCLIEGNEFYHQFRAVSCGLLLNYLMGSDEVLTDSLQYDVLNKIHRILDVKSDMLNKNEECLTYLLLILGLYSDTVTDCWFSPELNERLVDILKKSESPGISEMCLELLHTQAENDDVKLTLARCGLCETLYGLLETHVVNAEGPQARALIKLACNVIVLVLTGDAAMHYLYEKESFVSAMTGWLYKTDPDLLATGVLAVGNFARTAANCIQLVETGVMKKLLDILSCNNSTDDDVRLQHALLSALKNISIPPVNKPAVVAAGLVATILPMLSIHQPPVVFKLLGTLRMVVDGQEKAATELLQNKTLLLQLVEWCQQTEHPGVAGESPRLMAWLIKHCRQPHKPNPTSENSDELDYNVETSHPVSDCKTYEQRESVARLSLYSFLSVKGTVNSVASMLLSSHAVMQNEALVALTILVATFLQNDITYDEKYASMEPMESVYLSDVEKSEEDLKRLEENIIQEPKIENIIMEADLGNKLQIFLTKTKDTVSKEMIDNLLILLKYLLKSDEIKLYLNRTDFRKTLENLAARGDLFDKVSGINEILENLNIN